MSIEIIPLVVEALHSLEALKLASEGVRGGARGAMAPPIFGPASPRKFRKSY